MSSTKNHTSTPTTSPSLSELSWVSSLPSLPKKPGVYWFLGSKNQILYVGKSNNLSQRISSYKQSNNLTGKTKQLVHQASSLKFTTTDSDLDAILIEAELIKTHQPRFNFRLKDDKSPLYIYITNDRIPRVKTGRLQSIKNQKINKNNLFGPFPSGYKAKQILKISRTILPFCSATPSQVKRKQACFYQHINLCPGVCIGNITINQYQAILKQLRLFLRGKKKSVQRYFASLLKLKVTKKDFETAAILRDRLGTLNYLTQQNKKSIHTDLSLPKLQEDISLEKIAYLRRLLRRYIALPSTYPLKRIEAYDISNISGKSAAGSMVVFTHALPDKSQYRKFKIRSLDTQNDLKMLKEVFIRRIRHLDWPKPHLIVIDGGKTQLKTAITSIPWTIPIVSIAKNPDRLLIPSLDKKTIHSFDLLSSNPASQLLKHIRDESHRFAKSYHSYLRNKSLTEK